MAESGLPPGWSVHRSSKTGQLYWHNSLTGEARWSPPEPEAPPQGAQPVASAAGEEPRSHAPAAKRARVGYEEGGVHGPRAGSDSSAHASLAAVSTHTLEETKAAALAVAAKYDKHGEEGHENRGKSVIKHLKNFNNWVKASLIANFMPPGGSRVLDLACGRVGDLHKFVSLRASHYCGIDIAGQSVRDGAGRMRNKGASIGDMRSKLVHADLGACDLTAAGVFAPGEQFDIISIQFALHYLFQSERRALTFFRNIAGRLAEGGVFVGTIPDAAYLVRRLRNLPPGERRWGNDIYSIEFTEEGARRQAALGDDPYGVEYEFYLVNSVDRVPEYLVPWPLLERLAAAVGMRPIISDNFHAFYERMSKDERHRQQFKTFGVFNAAGSLSPEEWEAAGVYRVFAFEQVAPFNEAACPLPPLSTLVPMPPLPKRVPSDGCATYRRRVEEDQIVDLL